MSQRSEDKIKFWFSERKKGKENVILWLQVYMKKHVMPKCKLTIID